ncbi:hypothetical protein VAR608DRAFT_1065 [Variovorax sp. HW608]|uniref:hypothetical protein n=1 Tax=Variovorax sp. HW608 TaxID=1034889 RepID=UPI00081FD26A|nr:hypothetical protein [Variovorax sp. HW608]SCK16208.1 hypothetical protein VAR608DRAFT_1065 [Variovorax sp. HW608]
MRRVPSAGPRSADGGLYGVLCGFSLEARDHLGARDVKRMEMAANAAARLIAQARGLDVELPVPA